MGKGRKDGKEKLKQKGLISFKAEHYQKKGHWGKNEKRAKLRQ